jgi:predicted nucleic acid-binding protein
MLRGMAAKAFGLPLKQVNMAKLVKNGPHVLAPFLPRVRQAIDHITTWAPLTGYFCPVPEVWDAWFDRLSVIGGVHDAAHLALAEKAGARTLVTADSDFRQVKTLPYPFTICYL